MPPAGFGAVEKVWHQLAHAFCRTGHRVTLVGKVGNEAPVTADGLAIVPMRGAAASASLAVNLLKDLRYAAAVSQRVPPSDVVVTNSFWTPILLRMPWSRRAALVVHVARFPKGQMWLYRGATLIQAVSSVVADAVAQQAPGLRDKLRVLPNPVDTAIFRPPERARDRRSGAPTVLYVGRIHPEKGLALLVRAVGELARTRPGIRLRMVGPADVGDGGGGEAYVRSLQQMAGAATLEWTGAIRDPRALAGEYQAADCFCYPSLAAHGEASPVAPLEAMATGLPVIVSDLACFRDYLEAGRTGVVFDHRGDGAVAALSLALERVLADPAAAAAMGSAAARRALDFSVEAVAQRYLRMFDEAVARC